MDSLFLPFVQLLAWDAVWIGVSLVGVAALAKLILADHGRAMFSVFRRNFSGYFINPAGYVFLMLFVLISSAAGFWPDEFFNLNLATLGQLNKYLPIVLLFFIPSITMSIWADEGRQGTDELLLTLPASDMSIVVGKYLAAAGFFSASLLFSQLSNFWVLNLLSMGDIDVGLFFATYLGYWAMGLAMLALGMVASFFTNSLTVAFILGVVFNAPLVLAEVAKAMPYEGLANAISRWSFAVQFADFGRGVLSLRSISFFVMLIVVGIYLSLALIGRRHWWGGRDGRSMLGHYLVRAISLVLLAVGVNLTFAQRDVRFDGTTEKISSLSSETLKLVQNLDTSHPVLVEAFIGRDIPKNYAQTRVDLLTMVNEFKAKGGSKVEVRIYDDLDASGDEAVRAEQQYGIRPVSTVVEEDGALKQVEMIMGVAFTAGLEKVVIPFVDRGVPVEYELVRSLVTVGGNKRLRVGVVKTDAEMFGGFDMQRFTQRPKQLIIGELEKQYEVVQVDPTNPIETNFDVLLAVQPSSLTQPQIDNLVNAVRAGVPTAIFEDPLPFVISTAPGTGQPRRPQGGMMMGMGGQVEPKGDIQPLLSMLGLSMVGEPGFGVFDASIVWQRYNPYPKVRDMADRITDEWVFVDPDQPPRDSGRAPDGDRSAHEALNSESKITSRLNQLLLLYPGAIKHSETSGLTFTPLVTTGTQTGTLKYEDWMTATQIGDAYQTKRRPTSSRYVLAARVQGKVKSDNTGTKFTATNEPAKEKDIDVVFVSDIDLLSSEFLQLRASPQEEINWQFDNVTFVLNIVDVLAKEDRFVEIRKRQTHHSSLKLVEDETADAEDKAAESIKNFKDQFEKLKVQAETQRDEAVAELKRQVEELQETARKENRGVSRELQELGMRVSIRDQLAQQRLDNELQRHQRDLDRNLKSIRREVDRKVDHVRSRYRMYAGLLPPLPPLIVGLLVHWYRQRREQEGITEAQRR